MQLDSKLKSYIFEYKKNIKGLRKTFSSQACKLNIILSIYVKKILYEKTVFM